MDNTNLNSNTKWIIVTMLAVVVVLAIVFLLPKSASSKYKNLDIFAQCLTEKGTTMYGAYWCAHCKNQKALFGDAFKYVNYVECTEKTKECESAGIQAYPTWIFSSGKKLQGEVSLEDLAKESGCILEFK